MLDFKKWLLEEKKPKTAHNRIVALNQYCLFIKHPEYCVKGIKIHQSTTVENVITLEEYENLLDCLRQDGNERGYWMIKFLTKTGARVSEFIRLTKDGLDTGYCEMWTKGKIRRIYIPNTLIEESRGYFDKQESEYLFTNRFGEQMTARGVSQNIKNWAKKYGIRDEVAHPHSFRHLYAIEFLKHNSNISLLADLMGHSSVNTTSIYLKLSREEQMRQFNEASNW
ncbi:MAG: tyrosine-type recombinase/integrase [Butyrivibrio sp.]|nr:tyrosine-type recombinase/integrase [Butyrivibrio sp.]